MPWPGLWIYDDDQLAVFGTPKENECGNERVSTWSEGGLVDIDYIKSITNTVKSIQDAVDNNTSCFINNIVFELYLNFMPESPSHILTVINVRPCFEKRGLFTILLFIILEAHQFNNKTSFKVMRAIQITKTILLNYGFRALDTDQDGNTDMIIEGTDLIQCAIQNLKEKDSVKMGLGSLCELNRIMASNTKTIVTEQDWEGDARIAYFTQLKLNLGSRKRDPSRVFFLKEAYFPTSEQLKDPEFIANSFPKPDTSS